MATRQRTWAPAGPAPTLSYHDKHDRIATLAALTVSPTRQHLGLYLRCQPRNVQARDVVDCLRELLRHLRGPLRLRWDRRSIHRGRALEAVCQAHPRLHLDECPAYAPELNPTAQVWNDFKRHTANSLLRDTRHLRQRLAANTRRVRRSQATLRSCIRSSLLPSPP
jgi:transposase